MSVSDNDSDRSDVSEDGILFKVDSKGSKECNVSKRNFSYLLKYKFMFASSDKEIYG